MVLYELSDEVRDKIIDMAQAAAVAHDEHQIIAALSQPASIGKALAERGNQ